MSPDEKEARIWRIPPIWSIKETDPRTQRLIAELEKAGKVQFTPDQKSNLVRIINRSLVSAPQRFSRKQLVGRLEMICRHAEALADALEPNDSLGWAALGILGYYLQLKNLDRENLLFECTVLVEAARLITEPKTVLQEINDHSDDLPESLVALVEKLQAQLQQFDVPKGGHPPGWVQNYFIQNLYPLYCEAGGHGRSHWDNYKDKEVGAFLDFIYLLLNELHHPPESKDALGRKIRRILSA